MPTSDWAWGDDAWHLVNYVRSLSSDTQRERVEMKRFTIEAVRVKTLPEHPESGVWRSAPAVNLHLMPLWRALVLIRYGWTTRFGGRKKPCVAWKNC